MFTRTKVAIGGLLVTGAGLASAAGTSVLDTASKAAITAGFDNFQATALDVVSTAWPYMLAIMAIMFAPRIVSRIANSF